MISLGAMWMFPFAIVICVFPQYAYSEQDESCDVRKMSDRFIILNALEYEVTHGNTVTTKCKFTGKFSFASCWNGKWRIKDTECSPDNQMVDSYKEPSSKKLIRKKRGWRIRIRIRFRRVVRFIGRVVCSLFSCPSHRPRDGTKPEIRSCPKDQTVTAIPFQHHAFVDWTPPTAWDNFDGQVSVHINGQYRPGGPFFENPSGEPTTVGYSAKDKAGNMATCNFKITVRVVRCPLRTGTINDGYRKCHPSSDMVLGTVCTYGCYQGHELKGGPDRIECTDTGEWSSKDEPYCQKKECSAIVARGELSFTCSAALYFRSICTFGCNQGYDIPGYMRRTKVCLASGMWNGNDPECVDVAPPTFEQCPSALMFFPGDNEDKAFISWDKPVVIDNKDNGLEAVQIEGPSSASEQEVNTYTIKYTAEDLMGNVADDCTFDVIVKQLRCPRLYPLPYMTLNCTGTRRGSQCSFACDDNSVLNGSKTSYCKKKDNMPYSEWTMDNPPFCEILNTCPNLIPPANGALACDYWLGGRFCHPSCSEGYSVYYELPNMLICQDNGVWTQRDRLSDCIDTTNPRRRYVIMAAEFYFQGDCNDPATQMEIKQKFMTAIQNSDSFLVKKMCQSPQCNVGNVKVVCGSTSKRSTENMKILTDTYLNSGNGTLTSFQYEEEVSTVNEFLRSLQSEMNSGNFSIVINDEVASLLEMTFGEVNLDCPQNSVPVYNKDITCVECPPGTFYDDMSKTCTNCLRGSYQSQRAQNTCLSCPATQTTARIGATDVSECEDACLPGSWSNTGLPPCVECDIGYYEDRYGSTKCSKCPGNRITIKEGNKNVTDCVDFDIVFPNISTTTYTELQMFSVPLTAPFAITLHVICRGRCEGTLFRISSSIFEDIELTSSEIMINSESFDLAESLDLTRKWFHVHLMIGNDSTSLFVDNEKQKQFSSSLDFQYQNTDLNITLGGNGFVGTISQFNIVSNTTYRLNSNKYSLCNSESIPADLVNWNEFAYSNLIDSYINIPSRCDDIDGCVSNPCENGNCIDKLGGYTCTCIAGYTGKNCDVNVDDCIAHACQNNATCVDGVNAYFCSCEYGFTGELCEIAMVDGQWSEWDNWTACSVSCGNGTIQRRRTCSNPPPDNGGQYCNGSDTEIDQCSMEPCRECPEIFETENSTLSCTNITGTITCTHTCNDGYEFDVDVKSEYICGNETYYYWDFQTEDNPYARLPYCTEMHESTKIHVTHKAHYDMEGCNGMDTEDISNTISGLITAAVMELTCVKNKICTLSGQTILNCDNARRTRRDVSDTNVGFIFKLSCDTTSFGTETCFYGLEDAISEFQLLESNNTLVLEYNSNSYYIIQNASLSDSTVDCPIGTVPLTAYCIPCSIGHYYLSQECHACPKGSYQDTVGQASCTSCPEGFTTEGTNSIHIDDCIVPISVPSTDSNSIDIVLGVGISIPSLVIITIIIIALRQNKICKGSKHEKQCEKKYDEIKNAKFNPKTMQYKGEEPLSIIDCEESTNKLNTENSFVNESFDFDDILLNGVYVPPKNHWPIFTVPTQLAMKCNEKTKSDFNDNTRPEQHETPKECWTPKTSS